MTGPGQNVIRSPAIRAVLNTDNARMEHACVVKDGMENIARYVCNSV